MNEFTIECNLDELRTAMKRNLHPPINRLIEHEKRLPYKLMTIGAVKSIVDQTFPTDISSGIEYGVGPYELFKRFLLPEGIDWTQFDADPQVANPKIQTLNNSHRSLNREIQEGDIENLSQHKDSSLELLLGFNLFSALTHYDRAIQEIKRVIKPGKYFVHYLTSGPQPFPLLEAEAIKNGTVKFTGDTEKFTPDTTVSILYPREPNGSWTWTSPAKHFTEHLSNLFSKNGFRILNSGIYSGSSSTKLKEFNSRFEQFNIQPPDCGRIYSDFKKQYIYGQCCGSKEIREETEISVIVAQRNYSAKHLIKNLLKFS